MQIPCKEFHGLYEDVAALRPGSYDSAPEVKAQIYDDLVILGRRLGEVKALLLRSAERQEVVLNEAKRIQYVLVEFATRLRNNFVDYEVRPLLLIQVMQKQLIVRYP